MPTPEDLIIPDQSWISVDDAHTYLKYRLGASAWKDAPKDQREAALVTAKRQIAGGSFSGLPTDPSQSMMDAQCEQALFLLQQNGDNDNRAALQAQGVTAAGVVKEQYDPAMAGKIAFAPMVLRLLADFYRPARGGLYGATLTRDEDA